MYYLTVCVRILTRASDQCLPVSMCTSTSVGKLIEDMFLYNQKVILVFKIIYPIRTVVCVVCGSICVYVCAHAHTYSHTRAHTHTHTHSLVK